jgi:hypothetical protein
MPEFEPHILRAAARRAAHDPTFRALLLADPHAAMAELTGAPVSRELRIEVLQHEGSDVVVVIPPPEELAVEELDFVSGGTGGENVLCGPGGQTPTTS